MADTLADLERRARHLSATDRARLALSLIESLDTVDEGDVDEAWRVEAEARAAQIDRGEVQTTPAADVFAEVRRLLK
jgi:putative addiction module component (TIGR02574 family)